MVFRIRKKPQKPKRRIITDRFWIDVYFKSIKLNDIERSIRNQVERQINDSTYLRRLGLTLDEHYFNLRLEESSGYDDYSLEVLGDRHETDKEFKQRFNSYQTRLKSYNKWYAENKDKIELELERRKQEKEKNKERKALEKEKQIKKLQVELKKLRKA
jgi:hypothetical protein